MKQNLINKIESKDILRKMVAHLKLAENTEKMSKEKCLSLINNQIERLSYNVLKNAYDKAKHD